ncbi:MAG: hypothetical protein GXN92_01235 [Candidatus Micrarchaeota archaeon]|nr:hypothetical protein [Candidatus Micrarchaeota archaeon]
MKGLSYTTDLIIAAIILLGVVGLVVYAEGFLSSQWEDIYKLKLIASDAAYYLSHNMEALKDSGSCSNVMNNIVPSHLNYLVMLNGEMICSKGDIEQATKVGSGIAYGIMEIKPLNSPEDAYFYNRKGDPNACSAMNGSVPIYRCSLHSPYTKDEVLNPVENGLVVEGLIEVRVFT